MTLLLLLVLFQETSNAQPAGVNSVQGDREMTFTPIPPGNMVPIGNYQLVVPDDLFYAAEEDAAVMYRLARAEYIPNCVGIFFSKNDNWSFSGVVQHFPYQRFYLQPSVTDGYLEGVFAKRHLYNLSEVDGTVEFMTPATFDRENNTFSISAHYQDSKTKNTGFFAKKLYVSEQEAVVISVRANSFDDYTQNEAAINAMLASVSSSGGEVEPLDTNPTSYMVLLGLPDPMQMMMNQVNAAAESEGLDTTTILTSAVLAIFGVSLLIFAVRAMKNAEGEEDEDEDDEDASSEQAEA